VTLRRAHLPTVTWLELLQDLIMVVLAVTLFSGLQYSWGGPWMIWYSAAVIVAYGNWVAWVVLNNRFPSQGLFAQLTSMLWMVGAVLAAGGALWENWLPTEVLNLGIALVFVALGLRHLGVAISDPSTRRASGWAVALCLLASTLLLAGAGGLVPEYLALIVGPAIALTGLLIVYPRLLPASATINVSHLSERFGQFVLIFLGDGFLEIVLNIERGGSASLVTVVEAAAILFLLWRAYFIHVLPLGPPAALSKLQAWVAAHLVLVVGVGLTSASVAADAVLLAPELIEHLDAFTRSVGAGLTLAVAYLGLALIALASGRRSARTATAFVAFAGVLALAHILFPGETTWQSGLIAVIAMAVLDVIVSRVAPNPSPAALEPTP